MTVRRLLCLIALGLAAVAAAAPASSAAPRHAAKDGGIARMGTTEPFDSMNPFVAFQAISYLVFTNVYPVLVQYDSHFKMVGDWAKSWKTSKDGLTWTFTVKPGKWSDGQPLTADDAAWTGNTIIKFAKGPAASLAPFLSHATKLTAPNPTTLVIHYNKAVANVLPQIEQFFVLPRHVWEPIVGSNAKGLKDYDPAAHLPIVGGGSFYVTKYDKKGTSILTRNPGYYGSKPHIDALGISWFANSDAMIAALKSNNLDFIDTVPPTVAKTLGASGDIQVIAGPGEEVRDFAFNSSPKKKAKRELLDPKLRAALSHAFDRDQIADVVFRGYAEPRATLVTPISAPYMNTKLEPEKYDLALANSMLDKLGYKRGGNGIRMTPGANSHPMSYDVITPTGVSGINREFAIVRDSFAKLGVTLNQKAFDNTTAFAEITKPKNQYLNYDMMMWDWVGYFDPDFVLSVVGCDQYGGWSDTAYCNPAYDKLYQQQGVTLDPGKRKQIVWKMQDILYRDKPYVQLVQLKLIYGYRKGWTGIAPLILNGSSKLPWQDLARSWRTGVRSSEYVLRRIAFALATIFVAATLNFVIFRAAPGDATTALRCLSCTDEVRLQVRQELGLDKSKWQQYVIYLKDIAHGDFGRSFQNRQPVLPQLWQPLKNTLPMLLLGTLFSIVFGLLTGVIAAWRRGTLLEKLSVWFGLGFFSLPTQWLGIMLILYVAGPLGLPTNGISDPYLSFTHPGVWAELSDRLSHMVLPSLTIGLVLYGEYTLITRSALLETFGEDYVLTARAKGLSTWQVVRRHALRNSLLPITTLIFLSLGFITAGSILVEAVFNYPGIGLLAYQSVFQKDYPMLQGAFLIITSSIVLANLIADLLYVRLDPRIVE